jgi:hypothetical protein
MGLMNGYEKLMAAVATQQVGDFLNGINLKIKRGMSKKEKEKINNLKDLALNARPYIFDDTEESRGYIFGFNFICKYFSIDIKRARKSIIESTKIKKRN